MSDEDNRYQESSTSYDFASDEDKQLEEKERIQLIIDNMSPEEQKRYEAFRRTGFNRSAIRKLCNSLLNQSCNVNFIVSISGISKVFTGEMVELAKEIQVEWNDTGPLLPSHIHEAHRRMYNAGHQNLKFQNKNKFF